MVWRLTGVKNTMRNGTEAYGCEKHNTEWYGWLTGVKDTIWNGTDHPHIPPHPPASLAHTPAYPRVTPASPPVWAGDPPVWAGDPQVWAGDPQVWGRDWLWPGPGLGIGTQNQPKKHNIAEKKSPRKRLREILLPKVASGHELPFLRHS